jgi:hypothetical protein
LFWAVAVFDRTQVAAGEHATPLEPPVESLSGDSHQHLLEPLERFAEEAKMSELRYRCASFAEYDLP